MSVASAGLIAAPHGALSSQSIVLGAGALGHGYAAAAPVLAAPSYGYGGLGLGMVCMPGARETVDALHWILPQKCYDLILRPSANLFMNHGFGYHCPLGRK